ncbi:hypothetical protein K438DRAFT_549885 [Mycena galopus ATCC 62051]|nr:hypothetical protein K438DRAFT_549885 [Mycena galopus ATCC 62051]
MERALLYETIWVKPGARWRSLYSALHQPDIARLVCNVRLSSSDSENNAAVVQLCRPYMKLVVQPEFSAADEPHRRPPPHNPLPMPALPPLTHVHWVESIWSKSQFCTILAAAPNLRHLALTSSQTLGSGCNPGFTPPFPPLLSLESLHLVQLGTHCLHTFLKRDRFGRLTHLTIGKGHFAWSAFPVLPTLRVLVLVPCFAWQNEEIPFPAVFGRCPNLTDLQYDAHDEFVPPNQVPASLRCVRLYLGTHWTLQSDPALAHAALLLRSEFCGLERVVLDGPGWLADVRMDWPEWISLREGGCQVEVHSTGAKIAG